jgi:SAM domain (Sterile alpha motif)
MSKYYPIDDRISLKNTRPYDFSQEYNPKSFEKLQKFLKKLNIEEYLKNFKDNEIYFEDLLLLKENDILELNLPIGPRNRLLNALDSIENFQFEEVDDTKSADESLKKLKEIHQLASTISLQQNEMIEAIKKCQSQLLELKDDADDIRTNTSANFKSRKDFASTSPKVDRLAKPTLSSIAKQKVLPNKYMQVSPLRVSYYAKLMNK